LVIAIQNQSRPAIALAVDQAIAVGAVIEQAAPASRGLCESRRPLLAVNRHRLPRVQNAHADGRLGIEQSHGEKFIFAIVYHREFARRAIAILFTDTITIDSGMIAANLIFGGSSHAQAES